MDSKKIAVIVRDRQAEAFRMSVGLTILEDTIDLFLCRPLKAEEEVLSQLEGVKELDLKVFATFQGAGLEYLTAEDMAERLLDYDHILPY